MLALTRGAARLALLADLALALTLGLLLRAQLLVGAARARLRRPSALGCRRVCRHVGQRFRLGDLFVVSLVLVLGALVEHGLAADAGDDVVLGERGTRPISSRIRAARAR